MTQSMTQIIWQGTVESGTFRLLDFGATATPRFGIEQQQGPNAYGEHYWVDIGLPLADVLQTAFGMLYRG